MLFEASKDKNHSKFDAEINVFACFLSMVTREVTDRTIWVIGRYCTKLEALDISDLDNLTDESLEYITDGCRSLNSVKLTENRFRLLKSHNLFFFTLLL